MKKSFAKRFSLTIVVIMIALTITLCTVGITAKREPKRAIVIVTAFLSGGLYLNNPDGTQSQLWDPLPNYEDFPVQEVMHPENGLVLSEELINKAIKSVGGFTGLLNTLIGEESIFNNLIVFQ